MPVQAAVAKLLFKIIMNENPTLTFEFTLNEANAILAGLQELPAKICNPLSQKITLQAKQQLQQAEQPVEKVVAEAVE